MRGCVDNELDFVRGEKVEDVGAYALDDLLEAAYRDGLLFKDVSGATGAVDGEAHRTEAACDVDGVLFVFVANAEEDRALEREISARTDQRLGERDGERGITPHDLACRSHLGSKNEIGTREFLERKDWCFDGVGTGITCFGDALGFERLAHHRKRPDARPRRAIGLADER